MPKDLKEDHKEHKKKMVVVEEVLEVKEPKKEDDSGESLTPEVPVVTETKTADLEKAINSETIQEQEEIEKTNYLWIIVPTALLIGALAGGLITYFSGIAKLNSDSATPTPLASSMPEVSATPTATSTLTLKKDGLKVQVLNGSGVSGAAGKAKVLLEKAGYKSVDAGNANVSDLAQTEIAIKETMKEYLDLIIEDLSKSYTAVEASKSLSASSKYDIVVTIGKK